MTISRTAGKLGYLFREARAERALSRREVAKYVKVSSATLCRIENGRHKISLENTLRLCDYYGFGVAEVALHTVRDKRGRVI